MSMDNFSAVYLWLVFMIFVFAGIFSLSVLLMMSRAKDKRDFSSSEKTGNIIYFGGEIINKKDFISKSFRHLNELRECDNQPALCCGEFSGSSQNRRGTAACAAEYTAVEKPAETPIIRDPESGVNTNAYEGLYKTSVDDNMAVYDVEYNKYAAVLRPNAALRTEDDCARRDFLKAKKLSGNLIAESFEDVARILSRERGGKKIKRVSLTNRDTFWAMINEKADTIYFNADCLKRKTLLEFFVIPHEIYHSMIMSGRPGAEEILAYALAFTRVVNAGRMKGPGRKSPGLYNRVLSELREMEAAAAKNDRNGECPSFSKTIDAMAKYVSQVESPDEIILSDEKMVEIAVYYTVRMFKNSTGNEDSYRLVRALISGRNESEVNAEVMKLWNKKRVL